jgi:tRNA pseudouridine32 synthase/23S rRNA pseudouridine746 synthase
MPTSIVKKTVGSNDPKIVSDFIAFYSGLSKTKIKAAMNKGAAWLKPQGGKRRRIRRATANLNVGDRLELYYDDKLLALVPPQANCLSDQRYYSVWYKPAGLLSQGTMYADHCCLMRQVEIFFRPQRKVFLVHRLDREVSGIVILAHGKTAAAKLSHLFQKSRITKIYRAEVLGNPVPEKQSGRIDLPLDGKPAVTDYEVEAYESQKNTATVRVLTRTGRYHQIRRHFEQIGHPVMGDPRYGRGNKNTDGMKLTAVALQFRCPFKKRTMVFENNKHDTQRNDKQH